MTENKICENCEKQFYRPEYESDTQWKERRFCSRKCYGKKEGFQKGHIPWNKDLKGIHLSPETEFQKGDIPHNKGKLHPFGHKWRKGEHVSPETEIKPGQHFAPEYEFTSEVEKAKWADPDYKVKTLRKLALARNVRPTKPETRFMKLVEKHNLPLKYVGNGQLYIKEFNPDFINQKLKIIVEIFGDYWHNLPRVKERDLRRMEAYENADFTSIILWEHELDDESLILDKLGYISMEEVKIWQVQM